MADTGIDPKTGLPYGSSTVTGTAVPEVDVSLKNQDLGAAARRYRKGGQSGEDQETPPKREAGEPLGTYSSRVRKWREDRAKATGQKEALGKM